MAVQDAPALLGHDDRQQPVTRFLSCAKTRLWLSQSRSASDFSRVEFSWVSCPPPRSASITDEEGGRSGQGTLSQRIWASMYRARLPDVVTGVDRWLGCRAIVAVVEPADVRRHDDLSGRRRQDQARDRRVLLQCQVRSGLHVEVDNSTPTILSSAKSVIGGIRGSVVRSPCMRSLSSRGSPFVGAGWRRSGIVYR
jgi:hypothetical protein